MKRAIFYMFVLLCVIFIESLITYILSKLINLQLSDIAFFDGIIFIALAYFFTSSGGFTTRYTDAMISAQNLMTVPNNSKFTIQWLNPVLVGSVIYTVISLILIIIKYIDYFQ